MLVKFFFFFALFILLCVFNRVSSGFTKSKQNLNSTKFEFSQEYVFVRILRREKVNTYGCMEVKTCIYNILGVC